MPRGARVGIAEHGNSAVLVTIAQDDTLLDRRRIDLTEGLPTHPYHHEGSWAVGRYTDSPWSRDISLAEAVALVKRVEKAAAQGARDHLDALALSIPDPITTIALRLCPALPDGIEARIRDNRAQTIADTVMYRETLAYAARERDWAVYWYDRNTVFDDAAQAMGVADVKSHIQAMGKTIGPPWQARHKLAAAAALASQAGITA